MRTRRWCSLLGIALLAAACGAREPKNLAGLTIAGRSALVMGQVQRAMTLLERAVALAPEAPGILYDCARAESLAGDRDRALQHLTRTVDLGFGDGAAQEPDFRALAPLPGFQALIRRIAQQARPIDPSVGTRTQRVSRSGTRLCEMAGARRDAAREAHSGKGPDL
jgi:hypothetical protein